MTYSIDLDNVLETISGRYGVAFRVPGEHRVFDLRGWSYRRTCWYVAVPGLPHVAGPFGTYAMARKIINTKPDWEMRRRYVGLVGVEAQR